MSSRNVATMIGILQPKKEATCSLQLSVAAQVSAVGRCFVPDSEINCFFKRIKCWFRTVNKALKNKNGCLFFLLCRRYVPTLRVENDSNGLHSQWFCSVDAFVPSGFYWKEFESLGKGGQVPLAAAILQCAQKNNNCKRALRSYVIDIGSTESWVGFH